MEKLNTFLKNNINRILVVFLILQPILDVATAVSIHVFHMNITIGIMIRMLFLLFIMYMLTFVYKKKKAMIYYLLFGIYIVFYILSFRNNLFFEIQGLIRIFYFPLLLVSFYEIKEDIFISTRVIGLTFLFYFINLFIPMITNTGFGSYDIAKTGTTGWFHSANEISSILALLLPIIIIILKESKSYIFKILSLVAVLIVFFTIGTKVPILAFILTVGFILIGVFGFLCQKRRYKSILVILVGVFAFSIGSIIVLPKTNFYENISIHMNFLKIDSFTEVFTDFELVDHFIFSERLTFLGSRNSEFKYAKVTEKFIGLGFSKSDKSAKLVEMDYYDILYSCGYLGLILFFTPVLILLGTLFFNLRNKHLKFNDYMYLLSFFFVWLLSFFSGHVITAPAVSIFACILFLKMFPSNKKKLLFTSYDFGIGGIETSLVNLLKRIDYQKYDVTVLLEKKQGIFLNQIPKQVHVYEYRVSEYDNVFLRKSRNLLKYLFFYLNHKNEYDFSCCYATYSKSGAKNTLCASINNSFYVHSSYKIIYPEKCDYMTFFDERNITKFRHIIFVSNESMNDFREIYSALKNKTMVINNFVDPDEIKEKSLEKIKEKKTKTLFVFVGRLDEASKQLTRAIHLIKSIKDTELWLVGDGPDRKLYEDLVKQEKLVARIKFFGRKENPYPYMKEADYVLLTSKYEGFPVVYLESIILNKPIITTMDVSDDFISIPKRFGYIISDDEKMVEEVKNIMKEKKEFESFDFRKMNQEKDKKFEALFDGVI